MSERKRIIMDIQAEVGTSGVRYPKHGGLVMAAVGNRDPFNQYRRRKRNLAKLGFASYQEYLRSDLWKEIRLRRLKKDSFVCRRCGGRATQVHHRKYVTKAMTGENIGLLISLCGPCHTFCEWDGDRKTGPSGANGRIKKRPT